MIAVLSKKFEEIKVWQSAQLRKHADETDATMGGLIKHLETKRAGESPKRKAQAGMKA